LFYYIRPRLATDHHFTGPATSVFFEGILLILVRRPYDIGDRISVSQVDQDTNIDGSAGWIVENIDLYTTTVRLAATRELATISNGSIARSRIINMKKSLKAQVTVYLKFGINTAFSKIQVSTSDETVELLHHGSLTNLLRDRFFKRQLKNSCTIDRR